MSECCTRSISVRVPKCATDTRCSRFVQVSAEEIRRMPYPENDAAEEVNAVGFSLIRMALATQKEIPNGKSFWLGFKIWGIEALDLATGVEESSRGSAT